MVELHLPDVDSLKGKRHVLKGLKERVRARFEVSVAELAHRARARGRRGAQRAARAPRPPGHARDRLPGRPLDGARGPDPVDPQAGAGRMSAADDATPAAGRPAPARAGLAPPAPADVQAPFRRRGGRALMLGHVHPDADVLGTLLALGLALESRGWSVVYGGPHPAPSAPGFLPGVERDP